MSYTAESAVTVSQINYRGGEPGVNLLDRARYPVRYDPQQLDITRRFYSNLETVARGQRLIFRHCLPSLIMRRTRE